MRKRNIWWEQEKHEKLWLYSREIQKDLTINACVFAFVKTQCLCVSYGAEIRLPHMHKAFFSFLETDQRTHEEQSDVIVLVIGEEVCVAAWQNMADCVWIVPDWLFFCCSRAVRAVCPISFFEKGSLRTALWTKELFICSSCNHIAPRAINSARPWTEESPLERNYQGWVL